MTLIRSLVVPWILLFLAAITAIVLIDVKFPQYHHVAETLKLTILGAGAALCLMANFNSYAKIGIWMSDFLPESLRYGGSWRWLVRAFKAALVAGVFWLVSQFSWLPLVWHAAVLPLVLTISLFVFVASLLGPILRWSANLPMSRIFAFILSLPLLAGVPASAFFMGNKISTTYRVSRADLLLASQTGDADNKTISLQGRILSIDNEKLRVFTEWPAGSGTMKTLEVNLEAMAPKLKAALPSQASEQPITLNLEEKAITVTDIQSVPGELNSEQIRTRLRSNNPEERAGALREIYEFADSCSGYSKDIQLALNPTEDRQVVYWAIKAMSCTNIKSIVAIPRLMQIMTEHSDTKARVAAITALQGFNTDTVREVSYLLVKRVGDNEPPEVVEAAAKTLSLLGHDRTRWGTNRLKTLLESDSSSTAAARSLINDFGRTDLVEEYVALNLPGTYEARSRAVGMICLLPENRRSVAEPYLESIVQVVKTGDATDPAIKALKCLGKAGFDVVRAELSHPKHLDKAVAARALTEFSLSQLPNAAEVIKGCARDSNSDVRQWCSQSLGKLGSPALPDILEMLGSGNAEERKAGKTALQYFDDPKAKDQIREIIEKNSGWLANSKKLDLSKDFAKTLSRLDDEG